MLGDGDLVVGGWLGSGAQVEVGEGLGGQRRDVEAAARRVGLGVGGPLGHVLDGGDAAGCCQGFFGALDGARGRVLVLGDDDRAAPVLVVDAGGQARGHRRHDDEGDDDEGRGDGDGQACGDVAAAVGAQVSAQERGCCRHVCEPWGVGVRSAQRRGEGVGGDVAQVGDDASVAAHEDAVRVGGGVGVVGDHDDALAKFVDGAA